MFAGALSAQSLSIKTVRAVPGATPTLQLNLAIELGEHATDALQAGLLLAFDVDWQLADGRELRRTLSLRYSPLLRSYQLAIGDEPPQMFALRNGLLAAVENARLRWPGESACTGHCGGRVRARLNPAALPAPLRLPALFDSDWDFDSGWREIDRGSEVGHVGPLGLRDKASCHVGRCAANVTYVARALAPFQGSSTP
jgi:hypothetical protein